MAQQAVTCSTCWQATGSAPISVHDVPPLPTLQSWFANGHEHGQPVLEKARGWEECAIGSQRWGGKRPGLGRGNVRT